MKKFWLVFKQEYLRHVMRKRFIVGVLSVPLLVGVSIGLGILSVTLGTDRRPVGIIDQSELFSAPFITPEPDNGPIKETSFLFYETTTAAQRALDNREIQGFYTVDAGYLENGKITLTAPSAVGSEVSSDFIDILRLNLLKDQPAGLKDRLYEGPQVTVRSISDKRSAGESNFMAIALPVLAGILFIVAVNISGGYLLQAVVEEKENRTMEIILTSISTDQLMAGKIAGNLSVGLTQLLIWLAAAGVGALFFGKMQADPSAFAVGGTFLGVMALTFLPAFVMIAALMAMVGAIATEAREAQQLSGLFSLPIFIPIWFLQPIIENPNSPLVVGLSMFPLTSPLTLPMRVAFSTVPAWQIGLSLAILIASALGSVWLASRAFRLGMLRYGKKLAFRELFQRST